MLLRPRVLSVLAGLLLLGACKPAERIARGPEPVEALPEIPAERGPLRISLAYPRPGAVAPNADSTFVFGTVGNGSARLTINGTRVPVAPNGAFLAYLPVPRDSTYTFVARAEGQTEAFSYRYAAPRRPAPAVESFAPRLAVVTTGRDTLATGSDIAYAAPAPGADRRWIFPRGARLVATGRSGDQLRIRLTPETEAWISAASVELGEAAPAAARAIDSVTVRPASRFVDVAIAAGHAPFLVRPYRDSVAVVVYGRTLPQPAAPTLPPGGLIARAAWAPAAGDSAVLRMELAEPLWGFKAFYTDDGTLVVRLRRPPAVDPDAPLAGLTILLDPGHPPGGAIGPTGLTEAEANLAITRRLAEMLEARGARVVRTRDSAEPLVSATDLAAELWARVDLAVERDADLLLSVHNNAFAEGTNPFLHYGTETYYYYPFSEPLARALVESLQGVTGLPLLGAKQRSLALVRPSWMPSTLTESLFLMFPQQEAALRNPSFVARLAEAHLQGIERFLRSYLGLPPVAR